MSDVVDLTKLGPGVTFSRGCPTFWRMRTDGSLRAETWRDRWASAISETFWLLPTFVVTAIDHARRVVTVGRK
jgi:hypothetical protein